MYKTSFIIAGAFCILLIGSTAISTQGAAGAAKAAWEQEWDKVVAAAVKEGLVVIYTPLTPNTTVPLAEAFKKRYGIEINYIIGRGPEVGERIFTERNAGLFMGDIIIVGTNNLTNTFKPRGVLQVMDKALMLPMVADPKNWTGGKLPWVDKDHTSLAFLSNISRSLTRNTDLVSKDEIKSWRDLLQPKWKGKIILNDPTIPGPSNGWFTFIILKAFGSREKGIEYAKQLAGTVH